MLFRSYGLREKDPEEALGLIYSRINNPNLEILEDRLAVWDGADKALVFSSGMAALVGVLMAWLNAGDEVIFFDECYHRSREFCRRHLTRFGVAFREVKTGDYAALEAAISPRTRMVVSESPTNPHLSIADCGVLAEIGRRRGVLTLIDATLSTPRSEEHTSELQSH